MSIEYEIEIRSGVTVDGDGEIDIEMDQYVEVMSFTIDEMRAIVNVATAHHTAYQLYRKRDFESEEQYHDDYANALPSIGLKQ